MTIFEIVGPWVDLVMTLCILSMFLWKDNKAFRFAQVTLIAGAASIALIMAYKAIMQITITPVLKGEGIGAITFLIISFALGIMSYGTITAKYKWTSMWPMTFVVGVGMGVALRAMVGPQLVDQVRATLQPLNSLDSVIILISVFTAASYFIFSEIEILGSNVITKFLELSSKIGRIVLMMTFGSLFSTFAMTRITWLLGRVSAILQNLGLIPIYNFIIAKLMLV